MLSYRFIYLVLLFAGQNCFAQVFKTVSDPNKVLAALRKSSASANSIQADFKEEKYLSVLKDPEKSSGVFYYKKNDKMRWEQQMPFKYVILINGDKLRIQDAGKERNIGSAGRMAGQIKELMMGLVNGDFQDNKAFTRSFAESADLYQVTLTPVSKRLKNVYSKITLVFPKSTLRLKEITFFEKGGDRNMMRFQNEKINQPISESVFLNL